LNSQCSEYISGINGVPIHANSTENPNCRAALLLAVLGLDLKELQYWGMKGLDK
jgi:hypothetical protein